jgi:RNA polymerase sigma factor (sigma-70 family)
MVATEPPEAGVIEPDHHLIPKIARGDRSAFRCLFDRYSPVAMALAWRMLRQRHLAEETVQEVFLGVWRDPRGYREDRGSVRTWLMSSVHHRAVDLIRFEESQGRRATEAASIHAVGSRPADPAEIVVEEIGLAEDREAVLRALNRLGPHQRRVVELMYFEGLSQTRIAELLRLPLGTVKSRTRLAMRCLRTSLAGLERRGERIASGDSTTNFRSPTNRAADT